MRSLRSHQQITASLISSCTPSSFNSGFWSAYRAVRVFVHDALRREMRRQGESEDSADALCRKVYFTGHSLGGALATIAALDFELHSRGRINRYLSWAHRYAADFSSYLQLTLFPFTFLIA